MTIKDTQNKETGSGIYQSGNNGTFVLFHGITSKEYNTTIPYCHYISCDLILKNLKICQN